MIPNPTVLIGHFFAVAIYGIYQLFVNGKLIDFPQNILKSILILYTACLVIFPFIWSEVLFRQSYTKKTFVILLFIYSTQISPFFLIEHILFDFLGKIISTKNFFSFWYEISCMHPKLPLISTV